MSPALEYIGLARSMWKQSVADIANNDSTVGTNSLRHTPANINRARNVNLGSGAFLGICAGYTRMWATIRTDSFQWWK